jgi:hypothetical protein
MKLRLVDGGIPSFEWKTKRCIVPFSEEEKNELHRKIVLGEIDEKSAFKKRFAYGDDEVANRERYRKLIEKIPALPGRLVVGALKGGKLRILGMVASDEDLREAFRTSQKIIDGVGVDRYTWLKKLTKEEGISSVCFFLGRVD